MQAASRAKTAVVGAAALAVLAFGGVAYAQSEPAPQDPAQGPGAQQQEGANPGGGADRDCPREQQEGAQQTEV